MMLGLTPEHKIFKETVKNFVEKEIRPFVLDWEEQGRTPRHIWRRSGELGFLGMNYPQKYGGMGLDYTYSALFLEELAKCGSLGVALGICVQTDMSTPALCKYGSEDLKQKYLTKAISGEMITSIAVSEPDHGSDVAAIKTRATLQGDQWVINGAKTFITNGSQSDFLTLLARTNDTPGYMGLSLFIVPTNTPGLSRGKILKKTCYPSSDTAEIVLENVRIPRDHLIGEEGKGFIYQMEQFQIERLGGCILALGAMKRCYQITKHYIQERSAFGAPLAKMQVTRHKMAQMLSDITMVEHSVAMNVYDLNQGRDITKNVSMLKLTTAQIQQRTLEECVQIHGGWGLMTEFEVARYFRDSKLASIGGGTNEVMKEIICKAEGLF